MLSFNGLSCWQSDDFMIIVSKNARHLSLHVFSILSICCHLILKVPKYTHTHTHTCVCACVRVLVLYFSEDGREC